MARPSAWRRFAALLCAVALAGAGCGGDDGDEGGKQDGAAQPDPAAETGGGTSEDAAAEVTRCLDEEGIDASPVPVGRVHREAGLEEQVTFNLEDPIAVAVISFYDTEENAQKVFRQVERVFEEEGTGEAKLTGKVMYTVGGKRDGIQAALPKIEGCLPG
jgi:hypothetical protein